MTETTITCRTIDDLEETAAELLSIGTKPVFAFYGGLGAGKTTLIKAMCKKLGVKEEVSSPTYNIVNEYLTGEKKIFHFDLYRVKNSEELYDIGFEEYLYSGETCFIEWPEIAEIFLRKDEMNSIRISRENGSEVRLIQISGGA